MRNYMVGGEGVAVTGMKPKKCKRGKEKNRHQNGIKNAALG